MTTVTQAVTSPTLSPKLSTPEIAISPSLSPPLRVATSMPISPSAQRSTLVPDAWPRITATPFITFTTTLTEMVLHSSDKIQLRGSAEVVEFTFDTTEARPDSADVWEIAENLDGTTRGFSAQTCSYCNYHSDKYENLVCKDLAAHYRNSGEKGTELCLTRLFFEDLATHQLYEFDWLPRLGYRPISHLVWVGNDILVFHQWSQPHFGSGYAIDFRDRKVLFTGIIADEQW